MYKNQKIDSICRKVIILAILMLAIIPSASAISITLSNPKNISYPYSINLPLDYIASTDAISCHYTLNNGITNTTISNCKSTTLDVDFDGSYNFTIYAINATAEDSASIMFSIDRNSTSAMGVIAVGIIIVTISLVFFFGYMAQSLGKGGDYNSFGNYLGYFFFLIAFVFIIMSIRAAHAITREYLKVPAFLNLIMNTYYLIAMFMLVMIILFIFTIYFEKVNKAMEENINRI